MVKKTEGADLLKNIEKSRNTSAQLDWYLKRANHIDGIDLPAAQLFDAFPLFTTRQIITRFLELYELFKMIIEVPGSIIECGTGRGLGLMSFAHFASIFEPYHYTRKIVGFDTFSGFPEPCKEDMTSTADHMKKGGLAFDFYDIIRGSIDIYDGNRPIGHIPKVEVVKGDICKTLPEYISANPHLVVAMLYLDVDLYAPTRDALRLLNDRLVKGSMIVFDEINHQDYPGETLAAMEAVGLPKLKLRRLPFSTMTSYAIVD